MTSFIPKQWGDGKTVEEVNREKQQDRKAQGYITSQKKKTLGLPTRLREKQVTRDVLVHLGFHAKRKMERMPGLEKRICSLNAKKQATRRWKIFQS